nr:M48 family metalloprotease [Acinetobacter sp. Marseille-Q1620]
MKRILLTISLCFSTAWSSAEGFHTFTPSQFVVPEIGGGVGIIDQQREKMIGEKVYRQIQNQLPLIHDPWLEDHFMVLFSQLLSQTQLGQPIGLLIVSDPQINAFAVPGGLFALNTGMITSARNMDEVAGVMGHEIAHVAQRHYSRSKEAFKGQSLLALAGIIVGAALAATSDGDAGGAVMLGTQAALMDKQLSYSRDQEREADRIGMQFMDRAGYNPQAMADFFESMNRSTSQLSFLPDFWLTHPLTTERMSEARLRAKQFPPIPYSNTRQEFAILKWYTYVISDQVSEEQVLVLAKQKNIAGTLAASAFYLKRGDYDKAQQWLDISKELKPSHNLISILQASILLGQNKLDDAYQAIVSKQRIMPENRALAYKLAEVLIRQNKAKDVEKIINSFVTKNYRDVTGWQLLQQAASMDKQNPMRTVNVLRYRAESQYWSGQEENAIKSLLHAQRLAKNNESASTKISERLKVMQSERQLRI